MTHTRNNFTKKTQREAFAHSGGVRECHLLAKAGIPGFSIDGCGGLLGIGNTFYEHVDPDALSRDRSLSNCAALVKTCWSKKTVRYDLPMIAKSHRISDLAKGIKDPWRRKLPGGRNSNIKIRMNGPPVDRRTGAPLFPSRER